MRIGLTSTEERRKALHLEHCYSCKACIASGDSWEATFAEHEDCHGWWHCDPECCGFCEVCWWINPEIETALESWEASLA